MSLKFNSKVSGIVVGMSSFVRIGKRNGIMGDCEDLLLSFCTTTKSTSNEPKKYVVIMDRFRGITFRHGNHGRFNPNDETTIYKINDSTSVAVKIIAISDTADFIVFHTVNDEGFDYYPNGIEDMRIGKMYRKIGIDGSGKLNVKSGTVCKCKGSLMIGDNHAEENDSGAAIMDFRNNFIGMAIGKQSFLKNQSPDLAEATGNYSYAYLVPAKTILAFLPNEENLILAEEPFLKLRKMDQPSQ